MLTQNWRFIGIDENQLLTCYKRKCSDRFVNEFFLDFRDIHFFSWFFLSFFCMCIQESILKSEHSGWTWFGSGPVTWLWPDHSIRKFSTCWLGTYWVKVKPTEFWMFRVFVTLVSSCLHSLPSASLLHTFPCATLSTDYTVHQRLK